MTRFDACLPFTLKEEGGFVDNPTDPGGATNYGITLETLRNYMKWDCPVSFLERIDLKLVSSIYQNWYWNRMDCDSYPAGVDLMVFDFGVTAGQNRSIRILQEVVDAAEIDGRPGPHTVAAVRASATRGALFHLADAQGAWYKSLPTFDTFGRGWLARTQRRLEQSLAAMS